MSTMPQTRLRDGRYFNCDNEIYKGAFLQAVLARHGNKVTAMNHLDSELEDEEELGMEEFRFHELLQRPVQLQTLLFYDFYLQFSQQFQN